MPWYQLYKIIGEYPESHIPDDQTRRVSTFWAHDPSGAVKIARAILKQDRSWGSVADSDLKIQEVKVLDLEVMRR